MNILIFIISIRITGIYYIAFAAMRNRIILISLFFATIAFLAVGLIIWLGASHPANGFSKPDVKNLILRTMNIEEKLCSWCRETCRRPRQCCPEKPKICYKVEFKFYNEYDEYICPYDNEPLAPSELDLFNEIIDTFHINQTYTVIYNSKTGQCGSL